MQEEGQETHTQVCHPCPRPLACSAECGQRLRHPQIDAYDQRDALFKVKGCREAAATPSIDSQTLPASPSIALTFLQHLLLVHLCECQHQSSHSQIQASQHTYASV